MPWTLKALADVLSSYHCQANLWAKLFFVAYWDSNLLNVVFAKPDCFFSPLYNLKSLKLIVGPFDQTIQSTINLLNCSPNLEALAIYFDWFKGGDLWKIPDKGIPCLTHHLKTVENQLELVRFILKYGQVLQKMSITWGYSGVKYPIKISRQVKEFPRLSPTAALEFLEPFYEWFDHFGLWTRNTKENIWRKSILIRKNVVDSYLCICIHVF